MDFAKIGNLSKGNWKIKNIYLQFIKKEKKEVNENMGRTHFIIILNSIWTLKISISRTYKIYHQNYTRAAHTWWPKRSFCPSSKIVFRKNKCKKSALSKIEPHRIWPPDQSINEVGTYYRASTLVASQQLVLDVYKSNDHDQPNSSFLTWERRRPSDRDYRQLSSNYSSKLCSTRMNHSRRIRIRWVSRINLGTLLRWSEPSKTSHLFLL